MIVIDGENTEEERIRSTHTTHVCELFVFRFVQESERRFNSVTTVLFTVQRVVSARTSSCLVDGAFTVCLQAVGRPRGHYCFSQYSICNNYVDNEDVCVCVFA